MTTQEQEARVQGYKTAAGLLSSLMGTTLRLVSHWDGERKMMVVGVSYHPSFKDAYDLHLVDMTEDRYFGDTHRPSLTQEQVEALSKGDGCTDISYYSLVQRID